MKRVVLVFVLLSMGCPLLSQTDDGVIKLQNRLRAEGCYFGASTGVLDRETADALSRFQISRGLTPSGKLDATTARKLNVPMLKPASTPSVLRGSWQELPNGELEFVEERPGNASVALAPRNPDSSPIAAPPSQAAPPAEGPTTQRVAAKTPPSPADFVAPAASAPGENRFRDYVEDFVQAGLSQVGSEAKFFAERVDYFGAPSVSREEVQRDLVGYNKKWPHRRFWIDGNIQIQQQSGSNQVTVVFPLRYELRNGSRYASGRVVKSLTLVEGANNELQIVAVSESKAP